MPEKIENTAGTPVRQKLETLVSWLSAKKGEDIIALDLTSCHTFTEGIVIVTASSLRHAQGLADHVLQECRDARFEYLSMEGYQAGQWILLDLNDTVVSILQTETRDLYRLEDLWKNARIVADTRRR